MRDDTQGRPRATMKRRRQQRAQQDSGLAGSTSRLPPVGPDRLVSELGVGPPALSQAVARRSSTE